LKYEDGCEVSGAIVTLMRERETVKRREIEKEEAGVLVL